MIEVEAYIIHLMRYSDIDIIDAPRRFEFRLSGAIEAISKQNLTARKCRAIKITPLIKYVIDITYYWLVLLAGS